MKHKVGDEVLVRAKIIASTKNYYGVEVEGNSFDVCEDNVVPVPDMTAEEAWEIAKNLFANYSNAELDDIFGKGWSFPQLMEMTPHEAKSKIKAWEAEKGIKIGDVVTVSVYEGIVTRDVDEYGYCSLLFADGDIGCYQRSSLKKTGRHIDIEGLLKQIGGDE